MAFICDKLSENWHKDVDPNKVWSHLETMYNLEALDESESLPFPNTESEFLLPDMDFGSLLVKKEEEKKTPSQKGRETPKIKEVPKRDEKISKKDLQRRDSKDSKEKRTENVKKDLKKEPEKGKANTKGRGSISGTNAGSGGGGKEDKNGKDTPKPVKRPTRGSLKPNDDSGSSGKSSPVTVTPSSAKRRRI